MDPVFLDTALAAPYSAYSQMFMIVEREKERQNRPTTWIWETALHKELVAFVGQLFKTHRITLDNMDHEQQTELHRPDSGNGIWELKSGRFERWRGGQLEPGIFRFDPLWQPFREPYQSTIFEFSRYQWHSIKRGDMNNYHRFPNPAVIRQAVIRASYVGERISFIREYRTLTGGLQELEQEFVAFTAHPPEWGPGPADDRNFLEHR